VLCDKQYGGRAEITHGEISRDTNDHEPILSRQALHAQRLSLVHPVSGEALNFEAPLPSDLSGALEALRKFRTRIAQAR
jgi:23S rRNA pseudouridine1911/1915/1917 synthase